MNFRKKLYSEYKANRYKKRPPRWISIWKQKDVPLTWLMAEPDCCPWLEP